MKAFVREYWIELLLMIAFGAVFTLILMEMLIWAPRRWAKSNSAYDAFLKETHQKGDTTK